jgi:cytochrome c-type biogenesis protein CcsB
MTGTQLFSTQLFNFTTIGYFVSMVLFIVYIASRNKNIALGATLIAWIGFALNTAAITQRWMESRAMGYGHAPLSNLYESVVFFSWSLVLIYLLFDLKYKHRSIGVVVMPNAFLWMTWAQLRLNDAIEPLVPALQSNWLTYHVITCFIGYAAFGLAAGVSIVYLIKANKEKNSDASAGGMLSIFPSTRILDDMNYKAIMVGFPMLTLGIITGAAWANYAWGTYWSWDPKETWSLIVWFIYAAFLHARFTRGWVGNKAAVLSIVGFAATIFCYLGVNLVLSGLHSYGG